MNVFLVMIFIFKSWKNFYNQLYVGITRCRTNFLQIEDDTKLGPNTINALKKLIAPLLDTDVDLFWMK